MRKMFALFLAAALIVVCVPSCRRIRRDAENTDAEQSETAGNPDGSGENFSDGSAAEDENAETDRFTEGESGGESPDSEENPPEPEKTDPVPVDGDPAETSLPDAGAPETEDVSNEDVSVHEPAGPETTPPETAMPETPPPETMPPETTPPETSPPETVPSKVEQDRDPELVYITIIGLEGEYILPETGRDADGKKVAELLKDVCSDNDIEVKSKGSGMFAYFSAIGGLKEFQHGGMSGWVYEINGERISVGAGTKILKKGDVVVWKYTLDG